MPSKKSQEKKKPAKSDLPKHQQLIRMLSFRIVPAYYKKIEGVADDQKTTVSALIRRYIKEGMVKDLELKGDDPEFRIESITKKEIIEQYQTGDNQLSYHITSGLKNAASAVAPLMLKHKIFKGIWVITDETPNHISFFPGMKKKRIGSMIKPNNIPSNEGVWNLHKRGDDWELTLTQKELPKHNYYKQLDTIY